MKKIIMTAMLLASFTANAEVKYKIDSVSSLSFDGRNLQVEYQVGGGCQPHTTEIQLVEVPTENKNIANIRVDIYDVTPQEDFCEALLYQKASVDLQNKVKDLLNADPAHDIYFGDYILPKLRVSPYSLMPF